MLAKTKIGIAVIIACAIATSAGCSGPSSISETVTSGGSVVGEATDAPRVIDGSMVTPYLSAEAIAADATHLVVGTVADSRPVTIVDLLFTRYEVQVESTIAGEPERSMAVYLVGEPGWQVSLEVPRYLRVGDSYAMLVRPTGLPAADAGGDGYYIVGQGVWARTSATRFEWWVDRAPEASAIPREFAAADLERVLAADKVGSAR